MEEDVQIKSVLDILKELKKEETLPKNVKEKIDLTVDALEEENEDSIKINKALHELEEVADDPNLETYIRTQVWNIVSILEKMS